MNSKNLSKAINRMLAILLTAAMVAGSFTVPVKATEPVIEETSEDAVLPEEEETAVAEEITEEVEEPVGVIVEDGTFKDRVSWISNEDEAALSKVYDGQPVLFKTNVIDKIKVYTDSTKEALDNTGNIEKTFTYQKSEDGGATWTDMTIASNSNADTDIKDAAKYRVYAVLKDKTTNEEITETIVFEITKADISEWDFGTIGTSPTEGADGKITLAWTGGSAPAYAVSNDGDPESAVVYGADKVTSLTYGKPTTAGAKHDALYTALTSNEFKGTAGVEVTLEPGEGRNNLSNASTELTLENPVNPKNPKGLPYIKIDASGMANFTGTVIAPFSIAKKSGNDFAIDATNAQADVVIVMPEGKTGTIDLTKFVVKGEETSDATGTKIAVDKSEIESIKIAGKNGENAEKLFTTKVATISNEETIVPDFYTEKAEGDSFAYTVKDKAARTSDTATVELTYKLYNYDTAKTQDIEFTVLEDGGYSSTLKAALTDDEYEYKNSAPELEFTFTDDYQSSRTDGEDAFSDSTGAAYFFSVNDEGVKTYINKVNISAGGIDKDTSKATIQAPASLKAIGDYCVIVVYENTNTTPDTFTQAFDFSIVPVGATAKFTTPAFVDASSGDGKKFDTGSLDFDPLGTVPGYKELTIAVGSDELNNTQYDITPVSEYEEKDVYTNVWSYTANETRIKALDGYSGATTALMLADTTGATYGEFFVKDADGNPILAYEQSKGTTKVPIFLDQPYVKISIKDTCTEYASVKPIYIVYEITRATADETSAMKSVDKPEGTRTNIEIPLDGLLTVNGTTVYPNGYTVTLNTTDASALGDTNVTSFTENPTKDGKIKFSIKDSTALPASSVTGKKVTFKLTPDLDGIDTFEISGSTVDITVTFKSSVELTTTLKGVTGNSVTYTGANIVAGTTTSYTSTDNIVMSTMSGNDALNGFSGTSIIYKLAKETNNPQALDSSTPSGTTNQYEYDYDGDGVKELYTKEYYSSGTTLTGYTAIKDVGHYLVVTTASKADYTDAIYEYPLEVTPFVINDSRATIDFKEDAADDKVTYKGANYNDALEEKAGFIVNFNAKTLNPTITMPTGTNTMATTATDYVATVGELTKGSTGEPAYYLPVEVIFKENDLDKVTDGKANPYINNYSGTITGKLEVTATSTAVAAGDLAIAFKPYDAFKYTGEVQKPELKSISYKGNAKTGTEAEILAAIKNAIDPEWAEVKLEWPGDDGCASDGKSAVTQTVALKIGGLYDVSQTKTYSIAKEASTNIADAEEIVVDIAAAVGSTKVNLPLVFADKNDEEKTYETTGYKQAATVTKDGSNYSNVTASVDTTNKNVLTINAGTAPTDGEELIITAKAEFAGYDDKEVKVKVRVHSTAYKTTFSALAFTDRAFNNGPIEPTAALVITESAVVTTPTDGTVKYEWFKKNDNDLYESIGSEAPTHVGTYKVVVTLEDAKVRYATPLEVDDIDITALELTTTNASIDATDLENHVYDGKEHKAGIEITVKASALAGDEDLVLKESAEDPEFTINYGAAGANIYAGSVDLSTCTITGKTDGDYTFTIALSNLDAAKQTLVIGQKEVNLSLGNKSVVVDDTNTSAVKYADLSPEVTGLVEGDVVVSDNVDVEIVYARDENGNVIEIPENANLYKTPGTYTFRVNSLSAASIKNSATVPVEVGGSYKLAASRKSGTLTVSKPEKITPSITVSVNGTKITSDGKKFRTDETKDLLSVEVKNGSDILTKDTDYTVSIMKNADLATEVKLEGEYEVTVAPTSKYNFDSKTVKFTLEKAAEPVPTEEVPEEDDPSETNESYLKPGEDTELGTLKDIEEGDYAISTSSILLNNKTDLTVTYNGSAYTPKVKIAGLKQNEDFKVVYSNNTNASTEENKAIVKIVGINDYSGIVEKAFTIAPKPVKSLTVTAGTVKANATNEYTTDDVCFGISDGNKKNLVEDMDYTIKDVKYDKNKKKVNVVIEGIGNYGGTKDNIYLALSKADKIAMTECDLVKIADDKVYTGKAVKLDQAGDIVITYTDEKDNEKTLEYNRDYKVTYKNNINAGMATAIIKGVAKQGYDGTIVAQFPINRYDFEDEDTYKQIDVKITTKLDKIVYNGKLQTPKVKVVDKSIGNGKTLGKKDYVVFYTGELNAGKGVGTVIVKGINSYAGYVWSQPFDINAQEMKKATVAKARGDKYITVKYNKKNLIPGEDFRIKVSGTSGKVDLTIEAIETVATVDGDLTGNFKNFVTKKVKFEDINPDWIE